MRYLAFGASGAVLWMPDVDGLCLFAIIALIVSSLLCLVDALRPSASITMRVINQGRGLRLGYVLEKETPWVCGRGVQSISGRSN